MKKLFAGLFTLMLCLITLSACSEADKVNTNLSKQADYFECERRITVYITMLAPTPSSWKRKAI